MTSWTEVSNEIISRPARLILPFSGNLQLRHLASGFRLFFLSVAPIPSLPFSHLNLSTHLAFLQASNVRFFPLALGRIPQNRFLLINRLPSPPFSSFLLNPITRARPLSAVSASCHPHRRYLRIFPDHHSSLLFSLPICFGCFRPVGAPPTFCLAPPPRRLRLFPPRPVSRSATLGFSRLPSASLTPLGSFRRPSSERPVASLPRDAASTSQIPSHLALPPASASQPVRAAPPFCVNF